MRSDDPIAGPTLTLADLPGLIETARAAGTQVATTVDGTAQPTSTEVDLAIYRIVQESLTNARKHAAGAAVTIGFDWRPVAVTLRIRNRLGDAAAQREQQPGSGFGLMGMREWAVAAGGGLVAGTCTDEDGHAAFEVVAALPTGRQVP